MPKTPDKSTSKHQKEPWQILPLEELLALAASALSLTLTLGQASLLLAYLDELLKWNGKINLIGPSTPHDAVIRHLTDSLSALPYLPQNRLNVLDLGSGGGLPGLALKIARPDWRMTLAEANQKKTSFLRHVIRLLGLKGAAILSERIGEQTESPVRQTFDLITARALGPLPGLLSLARPLLAEHGTILAYKGPKAAKEVSDTREIVSRLGLSLVKTEVFELPFLRHKRTLLFFKEFR